MASSFPALYHAWMVDFLGEAAEPDEPRATCSSCAMLDRPGAPPLEHPFSVEQKCCTYQPTLANFLVGRILASDDELGEWSRRILRQRIRQRVAVTPLAIDKPPVFAALYDLSAGAVQSAFGRTKGLRCPYYVDRQGGLCGIWRNRNAVCATWFCKYERGPLGRLYARAVEAMLNVAETALRYWAVAEVGLSPECRAELWVAETAKAAQTVPRLDEDAMNGTISDAAYRELWGDFAGREEALYAACADRVAALAWTDVRRIGGMALENAVNTVEVLWKALGDREIPQRLAYGSQVYVQIGRRAGEARLRHRHMEYDWLDVPEALVRELGRFERAPVRQVLGEMQAEGLPIDEALVRKLLDWHVLIPA